ncbi:hypothetical protein Plhal304r1_c080g0165741 [Plasmopara halstedii]
MQSIKIAFHCFAVVAILISTSSQSEATQRLGFPMFRSSTETHSQHNVAGAVLRSHANEVSAGLHGQVDGTGAGMHGQVNGAGAGIHGQ